MAYTPPNQAMIETRCRAAFGVELDTLDMSQKLQLLQIMVEESGVKRQDDANIIANAELAYSKTLGGQMGAAAETMAQATKDGAAASQTLADAATRNADSNETMAEAQTRNASIYSRLNGFPALDAPAIEGESTLVSG